MNGDDTHYTFIAVAMDLVQGSEDGWDRDSAEDDWDRGSADD